MIAAPASNVAATLHRGRTVNVVGSATRPVSARTIRWCGHPSSRSLVHCGDVPDKRFVVLTALAVVAGAMVAVSAAGDGSGGPTDVQPAPDESPVEVGPAISVATSSTSSTDVDVDHVDDDRPGPRRPHLSGRLGGQQFIHPAGPLLVSSHRHLLERRLRLGARRASHRNGRRSRHQHVGSGRRRSGDPRWQRRVDPR